jgi:hypothetical protein
MELIKIIKGFKESAKILIIAIFISMMGFFYINKFLSPDEKSATDKMTILYTRMGQLYDEVSGKYTDEVKVTELQKEINMIQYKLQTTKLVRTAVLSLVLVTLVGILSWWLQYIYTDMVFKESKEGKQVMAYALLSSTIIIAVTFYIING